MSLTQRQAGLAPYWPYCKAANEIRSVVLNADPAWDTLQWRRRMEVFGRQLGADSDSATLAKGPKLEVDAICQPGELTDRGRETTLALGQRLRDLYVNKLKFLDATLSPESTASVYLRATPIQRALESTQQAFTGLYPRSQRTPGLPTPVIVQRAMQDETLFPNEGGCKRFGELAKAFADRAAQIWNPSPELAYVNKRIGHWMPPESPVIKVDSHPRLSGIMDTTNATLAHGPNTKLPEEFYDEQVISNVDKICVDEWFAGYTESNEYRKLGIGALVGDVVQNMVKRVQVPAEKANESFKISLSGCHDTTLAAILSSLGAYDLKKDKWPPYTSSIAIELFKHRSSPSSPSPSGTLWPSRDKSWWYTLFSGSPPASDSPTQTTRVPLAEMSRSEQSSLDGYYVRLRYNDRPMTIPACRAEGKHLDGEEGFCTLKAFKEAADSFTPKDWKAECRANIGAPATSAGRVERPPGL